MISRYVKSIVFLALFLLPKIVLGEGFTGPTISSGGSVSTDTTLADGVKLEFGTDSDAACLYDTAINPDSLVCTTGGDSNIFYLIENEDIGTNWGKSAQANPTFCIQSADEGSVNKRICFSHNQTDGVIDVDSGQLSIPDGMKSSAASGVALTGTNTAGGSANPFDINSTLGIMDGDDVYTAIDINITNADHTGDPDSNEVIGINIGSITGDDETVETAIKIDNGWDVGIDMGATSIKNALIVQGAVFQATSVSATLIQTDTIEELEEVVGIQAGGGDGIGLIIRVPDIGASSDEPGSGIQILADDGGSSTTGDKGGDIILKAGNAGGTGDNAGGSIYLDTGNLTGSGLRGAVVFRNSDEATIAMISPASGTTANYLQLTSSVASSGPTIVSDGSDTDISINMTPKGTGSVVISKADINSGTIDNTSIGSTTPSTGAFTSILLKNGSNKILNAANTDPDVFSGDLVQIQLTANGGSTVTGGADAYRLIRGDITLTTGTQSNVFTAAHFQAQTSGAAVSSGSGGNGIRGLIASGVHNSTGTVTSLIGLNSNAAVGASGGAVATGTVTSLTGNRITTGYVSGFIGTGAITNGYGVLVVTPQNTSSGSSRLITNFYGLYVEDAVQSGISNAYSIYTGTGVISLGGNIEFRTGTAMNATAYSCGRDADTPNQLHCNVPTGAGYELSVNDAPEYIFTASDVNFNNNTLSNIGGSGTDFLNGGRLVIGPTASASGNVALTIQQGNHTAINGDQPSLNVTSATLTLNSAATIGTGSTVNISTTTYVGVAGGGTETVTNATTLRVAGAPVQGADVTITNRYALWVDDDSARFDGRVLTAQGSNVSSAATITLGNGTFFHVTGTTNIDCITSTGFTNGSVVVLEFDGILTVNDSTGGCGAGTSNVNLSTAYVTTADDTLTLVLDGGSWDELARSAN